LRVENSQFQSSNNLSIILYFWFSFARLASLCETCLMALFPVSDHQPL
jgi:hypothetical protein